MEAPSPDARPHWSLIPQWQCSEGTVPRKGSSSTAPRTSWNPLPDKGNPKHNQNPLGANNPQSKNLTSPLLGTVPVRVGLGHCLWPFPEQEAEGMQAHSSFAAWGLSGGLHRYIPLNLERWLCLGFCRRNPIKALKVRSSRLRVSPKSNAQSPYKGEEREGPGKREVETGGCLRPRKAGRDRKDPLLEGQSKLGPASTLTLDSGLQTVGE